MIFYYDAIGIKSEKSGASAIFYYENNGNKIINITDGGYTKSTEVIEHINKYYGKNIHFDNVIVTHNDNDHAGGVKNILENYSVGKLWMLRPWLYAEELLPRFARYRSVESLSNKLREIYSNLSELEEIAESEGIPIYEPFQGCRIGKSLVLAPSKERYLDLIIESEKTPQPALDSATAILRNFISETLGLVKSLWGQENFSSEGTSAENEMSVVQFINLEDSRYLLTGDAGREGLTEALDFLEIFYGKIPKITLFEVPHHGSRHNLSTELMDRMFGKRLVYPLPEGQEIFRTIIHASKDDPDHPRKAVVRAIHHRGGKVNISANGYLTGRGYPQRPGWGPLKGLPYPEEQEE